MRLTTRLAVLSLVWTVIGAVPEASAHGHGLRDRHRRDEPAKRLSGASTSASLLPIVAAEPGSLTRLEEAQAYSLEPPSLHLESEEGIQHIIPLPTPALPPEVGGADDTDTAPALPSAPSNYNHDHIFIARANSTNATSTVPLPLPPSSAPLRPPRPVPTPLDLSISHSLSSGCMIYLASLLSSTTFLSCLPLSLLLTTSSGYSTVLSNSLATGNYTYLNNLLSYTSSPQPSGGECETYMQGVMSSFTSKSNCASDISSKNEVALQAKRGIGNYEVIRYAQALTDETSGSYCYIIALASKRPDDLYLWGLASGISLPASSTPTCSPCSRALLNSYTAYIPHTPTLNATLIGAAVKRVNTACGQGFVNLSTSTNAEASSGRMSRALPFTSLGFGFGLSVVGVAALASTILLSQI